MLNERGWKEEDLRFHQWIIGFLVQAYFVWAPVQAQITETETKSALSENRSEDMVRLYLQALIDSSWQEWMDGYEKRVTPDSIRLHFENLRERFIGALGGFPERTPLNARIIRVFQRSSYRVEKVLFESQPGHYVTAVFFLPDSSAFAPPYPGVLVPCGHFDAGKAHDEYQSMGALCALNGMAALVFDPIDQGERIQFLEPVGNTIYWGTRAHTMAGIAAMLLGQNIALLRIWDGMRAIDYLESRPEVDGGRIGCTGNSGGGTQTAYLTALDSRIMAAAPSCYIHRLNVQTRTAMGDAEQNIYGQLSFGLDHPDYLMMRAPVPVKLLAATHDFFDIHAVWETFRLAKRHYTRLGFSERMDILENDAGHNYDRQQREAAAAWLRRWLRHEDVAVSEPDLELFTEEELQCTPEGQVMRIRGARSVYDILDEDAKRLAENRKRIWKSGNPDTLQQRIRQTAGIRPFGEIEEPDIRNEGSFLWNGYTVRRLVITPETSIALPAFWISKEGRLPGPVALLFHEEGKSVLLEPGGMAERILESGMSVLAADIRGTGETRQNTQTDMGKAFGYDWKDMYSAYLLGRSMLGMRTEDIFACVKAVEKITGEGTVEIHLAARGNAGIPALHAAALEPDLFKSVRITRALDSWSDIIRKRKTYNQLVNAVHGALALYDLPDLVRMIGDKITIEQPLDARGFELQDSGGEQTVRCQRPELAGLAGIWYGSRNLSDPKDSDPVSDLDLAWNDPSDRGREWSAEWFGTLLGPADGKVRFFVESSHGGCVTLDRKKILKWEKGNSRLEFVANMRKGKAVPIHILYNHDRGDTGCFRLLWSWKDGEKQVIKQAYLRHAPSEQKRMRSIW